MSELVPIHLAVVYSGQIIYRDTELLTRQIVSLEGKDVEVTIRRKRKHRSNPQNAYYWGVIIKILSEYWGYSKDEAHYYCLMKFSTTPNAENPKLPPRIQRSKNKSTIEFMEYCEQIRQWAAMEFGLYIPDPNEIDTRQVEGPIIETDFTVDQETGEIHE